ncbi:hypothetical protein FQN52_006090 [Onygenales sp. PD_12]|nr:hypothetical protein FQN52_006090 [Onygenales sp. PD_12]
MAVPTVQILSKDDFTQQHIVPLPNALPLPPLTPSSVRVKTSIFALTANNTTYAKIGYMLGWWDVHPLPASTPPEFQDADKFGRISAWGFGVVEESTYDNLPVNSYVWGYLPIGTLPVDLTLSPDPEVPNRVLECSPARAKQFPVYNMYTTYLPEQAASISQERMGWDSLLKVLFKTSFGLNRFVLAWDESNLVQPFPAGPNPLWTMEQANVTDSVVIQLAGSGKTALALAHQLKFARPPASRPRKVIAVTSSAKSKAFVEATGYYDSVWLYDDIESTGAIDNAEISTVLDNRTKVVLCDFGSRGSALVTWLTTLKSLAESVVLLGVGSEPKAATHQELEQKQAGAFAAGMVMTNASDVFSGAQKILGGEKFAQDFSESWDEFVKAGAIPGMQLEFGYGMEAVGKAWDKLCVDGVGPETGLVFKV